MYLNYFRFSLLVSCPVSFDARMARRNPHESLFVLYNDVFGFEFIPDTIVGERSVQYIFGAFPFIKLFLIAFAWSASTEHLFDSLNNAHARF